MSKVNESYIKKLETFRDRLLEISWRNPSILLRKTRKKSSFDLTSQHETVPKLLERALTGKREFCLIPDSIQGLDVITFRESLRSLHRQEVLIEEESGIHDLFIGFPFLSGNLVTGDYVRAPLVLIPTRLEYRRNVQRPGWYLTFTEDEAPRWNRTLIAALNKVGGFSIPTSIEQELEDAFENMTSNSENIVASFLAVVQKVLNNHELSFLFSGTDTYLPLLPLEKGETDAIKGQPLAVIPHAVLGLFSQASNAIYMDYESLIERAKKDGEEELGVMGRLIEVSPSPSSDENAPNAPFHSPYEERLDKTPDRELNTVLLSDVSQDAVIVEARQEPCTVVRGPPGTGKSQMIANLISNALSRGERVALVCQKRTALSVVFERLKAAGLSELVLFLESEDEDRKIAYDKIHGLITNSARRGSTTIAISRLQEASQQIDDVISELNSIVIPMWKDYYGTKLEILYASLPPNFTPRLSLSSFNDRINNQSLIVFVEKLAYLQDKAKRFDDESHPFSLRTNFSQLDAAQKGVLQTLLSSAEESLKHEHLLLQDYQYDLRIHQLQDFIHEYKEPLRRLHSRWRQSGQEGEKFLATLRMSGDGAGAVACLRLLEAGRQLNDAIDKLKPYLGDRGVLRLKSLAYDSTQSSAFLHSCIAALTDFDSIQEYDAAISKLSPTEYELLQLCKAHLATDEDWPTRIRYEFYFHWTTEIERAHPQLRGDPFKRYDTNRLRLQNLMEEKRKLVAIAIQESSRQRLNSAFSTSAGRNDWNKFDYELKRARRLRPFRWLFETFQYQVEQSVPCWLLSPESLSAILPLKRGLFDLLIFDEASQLAIERSLPAIYRTKRVVIAGDEKQLPPFNLFRLKGDDEDEDEDDAGEETNEMLKVESLLAAARRIFGFRYLSWHYRSRFQELIDFSNQAFYEGQLMIPVNLVKDSLQRPIRWVKCEGSWNNRRNLVEANQVVEEIHHVLKESQLAGENKPPSIGVVTFNEPQMTEVLNAIENKQESDPEFKQLYAEVEKAAALNPDRSLLVRNIENVQGYERDVMIFSIGYARDSDGKFRAQFGSLNTEGGENRLNVAITRAKQSVIVCCSFDPELLREDYAHDGPKYLKLYLLYARAVSEGKRDEIERILAKLNQGFRRRIDDSGRQSESPFEDEVYDALTATGYKLDKQVGYSGYRIDLAVANPKDPKHFILAIECDGATFHSARSARERDVIRQRFLEDRGWVVERVWSRSWWHNRDSEVERLRNRIEELSSESPTIVKE